MPFPPLMNAKAMASNIAHAYGINLANPAQLNAFERINRNALEAAYDASATYRPILNGQFNLVLNFIRGLDQGGNPAGKLAAIGQINAVLGTNITELHQGVPLGNWIAFATALNLVPVLSRPHLRAFYNSRNAMTALRDLEGIFAVANPLGHGQAALNVMCTVMAQVNGDASGITAMTIVALIDMLAAYPPMGGFAGFPQWGPGDQGNPVANLDAHVLKHVCRQPLDVEFGVSETMAWWALLNVQLTLAEYNLHAVNATVAARNCFDGANPLANDRLKRFLVLQAFTGEPALTQLVKNKALNGYRDYAINNSAHMTNVIVHSNGTRVFISGQFGNAFIIGRFEGAQLGISSAYIPLDLPGKLAGARANLCWPLV